MYTRNENTSSRKLQGIVDFEHKFNDINNGDFEAFEIIVRDFVTYLAKAITTLPGPKHPAVSYFNVHKANNEISSVSHTSTKKPSKVAIRNEDETSKSTSMN